MKFVPLAAYALAGLYTIYLALLVNAASPLVVGVYIVASLAALVTSMVEKPWAARVKWTWIALSLVVIYAVVSGPLDYLRVT